MIKLLAIILTGFFIAELIGNSPIASAVVSIGFLVALPVIAFKIFKAVTK